MSGTLTDPLVGRVIDGRYVIRGLIAHGGMASVYRATDKRLGRDVALKVMSPELIGQGTEFSSRFRREARSAARLTHPGMVRVYDQGTDGDINYLTMELVEGRNLRQVLAERGTLPVGQALSFLETVLDTLSAAHRQNLVHRDIKPENVLVDEEGNPKVADFGLARAVTEVTATTTGTIMGTVAYLGPELVAKGKSDARTDVYAAGILFYEMVTGRQPFTGGSAIEIAARHVHEDVPPPSLFVPWLPPEIDALVARLVDRDPRRRPADASEALALVRQTHQMLDEPTLDRKADPPSGAHHVATTSPTEAVATGQTVALPIGLGEEWDDEDGEPDDDLPADSGEIEQRPRLVWWVGAIAAAVGMLAILGTWWYTSVGPGAYTNVPAVAGDSVAVATTTLEALGLDVTVVQQYDDAVAAGEIIGTDPEEGGRVAKGGDITLLVSQGPKMQEIPVLVGIDIVDAQARLDDAGFPDPTIDYSYSDTIVADEVISSDPLVGEVVRHDTVVTLVVSQGPEPITIPDVIGATEETALSVLGFYALDIAVERGRTSEVEPGQVYDQDPAGNADGFRTQQITIWVSDGYPLVEVPNFTYNSKALAQSRADELGLVVTFKSTCKWYQIGCDENVVKDQSIEPGQMVEVGTELTLFTGLT